MKVGVLALQGAFTEHEDMLSRLGAECFEIRRKQDLTRPMDGLVLPGGESTVMGKLLRELELFQPLKEKILEGLPAFGTCAGLLPVSYTHLDVYKRQAEPSLWRRGIRGFPDFHIRPAPAPCRSQSKWFYRRPPADKMCIRDSLCTVRRCIIMWRWNVLKAYLLYSLSTSAEI